MSPQATPTTEADLRPAPVSGRIAVAWQAPGGGAISAVGLLERTPAGGYRFRYLQRARSVAGFRPFLGFPDLARIYESDELFPFFSQRVMNSRRPDYSDYIGQLGLSGHPDAWQILGRSQGRRGGDRVLLIPEPAVGADGRTDFLTFVHGIRHRVEQDASVEPALRGLRPGDRLHLTDDVANTVNPNALLVSDGGVGLGWVPDLLLDFFREMRRSTEPIVTVDRINDPAAPPQIRLLVRVSGTVEPGVLPFSGPGWALAGQDAA